MTKSHVCRENPTLGVRRSDRSFDLATPIPRAGLIATPAPTRRYNGPALTEMSRHRSNDLRARLWRLGLRLKFLLFQRHRHDREVVEKIGALSLLVRPGVFNPALFRVTPVFLEWLGEGLVSPGSQVLDLGTGTGVLAIAAASTAKRVVAVDSNPTAVECARINAEANSVEDRVELRLGDLFAPVVGERFDLVLCNPPYFAGRPATQLETAFRAGDFARRLSHGLGDHLEDHGRALVILSSIGDEGGFLAAFDEAGLTVEPLRHRDLVSEIVTLYELRMG